MLWLSIFSVATADEVIPSYDRVRVLQPARTISDVELTNQNGRPFRLSDLHGQVAIIFFGFTNCPDVCPIAMAKFQQLQNSGDSHLDRVAFVLISVDGERDTPDVLKAYLRKFSRRFIGLTGDPDKVKLIAKEFSAAFYKGNLAKSGGQYTVSHSPQAFVLDTAGKLRAEFYNPSIEAMAAITLALLKNLEKVAAAE